jgi:hypothetical protein
LRCSANQHAKDAQAHALSKGSEGHDGGLFFHISILMEKWNYFNREGTSSSSSGNRRLLARFLCH